MTRDPELVRAAELEAEAAHLRAEAERRGREAEALARQQAEAGAKIEALRAEAVTKLDGVVAEVRRALPGSGQWAARVTDALRRFEQASDPYRGRAGIAREAPHRVERVLSEHPVGPMMAWLQRLAAGSQSRTSPGVRDSEQGPESGPR